MITYSSLKSCHPERREAPPALLVVKDPCNVTGRPTASTSSQIASRLFTSASPTTFCSACGNISTAPALVYAAPVSARRQECVGPSLALRMTTFDGYHLPLKSVAG